MLCYEKLDKKSANFDIDQGIPLVIGLIYLKILVNFLNYPT